MLYRQQHNSARSPQSGSYFISTKTTKLSMISLGKHASPTVSNLEISRKPQHTFPRKGGGLGWRKTIKTNKYKELSIYTHEHQIRKVFAEPPQDESHRMWPHLPLQEPLSFIQTHFSEFEWGCKKPAHHKDLYCAICMPQLLAQSPRFLFGLKCSPEKQQDHAGLWWTGGTSVQFYFPGIQLCIRSCCELTLTPWAECSSPLAGGTLWGRGTETVWAQSRLLPWQWGHLQLCMQYPLSSFLQTVQEVQVGHLRVTCCTGLDYLHSFKQVVWLSPTSKDNGLYMFLKIMFDFKGQNC